jgi:hypothetical protein
MARIEPLFDVDSAMKYLKAIWDNDRFIDFAHYNATALNVARFMKEANLSEVVRTPIVADGCTPYGDWVAPQAWNVRKASLSEEGGGVIAAYADEPCSLVMYSAPTAPGGVSAEAVNIDDGVPADGLNAKIIFTSQPAASMIPLAKQTGAIGIVTDFVPLYPGVRSTRAEVYDLTRWDNTFAVPLNGTGLWAFSLSPRKGDKLRESIRTKGHVKLHAIVDTVLYNGEAHVISGCIPGQTDHEILIYGHLCEPGANDNCSGCSVILELARCLSRAIQTGVLPKPKRTLRFVAGYECVGSMAYAQTFPERIARTDAALVTDMIGADVTENTYTYAWRNPLASLGFTDVALTEAFCVCARREGSIIPWALKKFSIGTDSILADPMFGVPTPAMVADPALRYHSSWDRPETIDTHALYRNAVIAGTYLWYLANAGAEDAKEMWARIPAMLPFSEKLMAIYLRNEILRNAAASMGKFCPEAGIAAPEKLRIPFACPDRRGERVVERIVKGTLTFDAHPELLTQGYNPAWNTLLNSALFWMDGKRSLWEAACLSAAEDEQYTLEEAQARFELIDGFVEVLIKAGYARFVEPEV